MKRYLLPIILIALISAAPLGASAQLSEKELVNSNLGGPVFLDAFWTDRTTSPPVGTSLSKVEVAPGEGASILAVTLVNRGFSDITAITGSLSLPSGFNSGLIGSNQAVASYNGIVPAGSTFTLFFQVNITNATYIMNYSSALRVDYSRTLESGAPRSANIDVPFKITGKVIIDSSSEDGVIPGTSGKVTIKITNMGSAPATGVVVTLPGSAGISPTSQQAAIVAVGQKSYEFNTITPRSSMIIQPVLYASSSSGESLQVIPLQISYGNAYGEKKNTTVPVGMVILPKSSSSRLSAVVEGGSNSSSSVITAGKIANLTISLTNNGDKQLSNVVASLSSKSDSIKILGKSSWNIGTITQSSSQEISTQVFASTDMIGKATTFTLTVQRMNAGLPEVEVFDIGTYVAGEISIKAYDIGITYIGGVPNLSGNLLNEGNTLALFTTIDVVNADGLVKSLPPQQYLGDLTENSPLPFSIPIEVSNGTAAKSYPVELKIQYKDGLRIQHSIDVKTNVDYVLKAQPENGQQNSAATRPIVIAVVATLISAVVIAVIVIRMRKRSKLKNKLQFSKQNGNGEDIDSVLDSQIRGSSSGTNNSSNSNGRNVKKDERR